MQSNWVNHRISLAGYSNLSYFWALKPVLGSTPGSIYKYLYPNTVFAAPPAAEKNKKCDQ